MLNKYYAEQQKDGVLDIFIFGDITSWPWIESDVSSYTLAKQLAASDASEIHVRINSYGGEVAEAMAIYSALKTKAAAGVKVTTSVEGFACSAASMVFMAGSERVIYRHSMLMIHNAWTHAAGNADELHKAADDLEKINAAAVSVYKDNIAISDEALKMLLAAESWLTADEALEAGFATVIRSNAGMAAACMQKQKPGVSEGSPPPAKNEKKTIWERMKKNAV